MSSTIENIVKQAIATFSKSQPASTYQKSLNDLAQSVSKLTGEDVGVTHELVKLHNRGPDTKNPIGYVTVYNDSNIIVNIFVLKSHSVVPLHDHPIMHGIVKVLHGCVRVNRYSLITDKIKRQNDEQCSMNDYYHVTGELYEDPVLAHRNYPSILTAYSGCEILTPLDNNIHEVTCVDGPAAFLDILAPPYETNISGFSRQCTYFDIGDIGGNRVNYGGYRCSLLPAAVHPDYWTIDLPYGGPKIIV